MKTLLHLLNGIDPIQEYWARIPVADAEELEIEDIELWEDDDGMVRVTVQYPRKAQAIF